MNRSNMTSAKSVAVLKMIFMAITLVIFSSNAKAACDPADYSKTECLKPGTYVPLDSKEFQWAKDLGVLRGSFYQMGIQYGERAAKEIREMFDYWVWPGIMKSGKYASPAECVKTAKRYRQAQEDLSPEWMEIVRGITKGATPELNKSIYNHEVPSHFDKIFILNLQWAILDPPKWRLAKAAGSTEDRPELTEIPGCNSMWATGAATKNGQTITHFSNQHTPMMNLPPKPKMTFVMIPDDPKANIVWVLCTAGRMFQNGMVFNDKGIFFGIQWGGPIPDTEKDFGCEVFTPLTHAAFFAKNPKEAVDILTIGTPEYRQKTGRKTLLRNRQQIVLIADKKEAYQVEYTAKRFAIRKPGDLGEIGSSYIAGANNYFSNYSYDENNVRTDFPMTSFNNETSQPTSSVRQYTYEKLIRNNYGKVDKDMVMYDFATVHYHYLKDGTKVEPKLGPEGTFSPIPSVCNHATYQTYNNVVILNETLDVWYVTAWPCLFKGRAWSHVNLGWFKLLRDAAPKAPASTAAK